MFALYAPRNSTALHNQRIIIEMISQEEDVALSFFVQINMSNYERARIIII